MTLDYLTILSVGRLTAIVFPFQYRTVFSFRRTLLYVMIFFAFSFTQYVFVPATGGRFDPLGSFILHQPFLTSQQFHFFSFSPISVSLSFILRVNFYFLSDYGWCAPRINWTHSSAIFAYTVTLDMLPLVLNSVLCIVCFIISMVYLRLAVLSESYFVKSSQNSAHLFETIF